MLTKPTIVAALRERLEALDDARAATLGGSDSTGRADDWSDIDLMVYVRPGAVEAAAGAIDAALTVLSPVSQKIRLPMPTWHGFNQAFIQLQRAPEHLMIDWVIVETDKAHPWFEVERHGTPRVLFDKDGLVKPAHADAAALKAAAAKRVGEIRARFAMFRHLPAKQAARGLPVDAAAFYHSVALRSLVDLARCVHCPLRHDFGMRYLERDLPAELNAAIARLCYPRSAEDVPGMVAEASGLVEGLLAEFDARAKGEPSC